ncbi:MAG: capsule assembly Wzi family protein [Candidatus Krumholzibacteriia bacterium]
MIHLPAAPGYARARGFLALLFTVLAVGLAARGVSASLWADGGDTTLRHDIEVLAGYGLIEGPVTAWPVPWAQVGKGLDVVTDAAMPVHVRRSLARVRRRLEEETRGGGLRYEVDVASASRPRLIQNFGGAVREELDGRVSVERRWKSTFVRLSAGYEGDEAGDFKADGTYVAQAIGNWAVYGGYVEQWWGPGWGNSLVLSNNARPFPAIGVTRLAPEAFESRWLRWMGHWRVRGHLGVLDDGRAVSAPLFFGMRLTLTPLRGLEIAVTRTLMICGSGRPCGIDTWIDALLPFNEADNTGMPDDPSNQLAGFGLRYAPRIGDYGAALYGQYFGEDEIDLWVRSVVGLFGLSVDGPFLDRGAQWRLTGEYSDTAADGVDGRSTSFNVVYNHSIYQTGYRYRGRAVGHGLDGDSRLLSFGATLIDSRDGSYHLRYHRANVNRDGASATDRSANSRHTVSASAETVHVVEIEAELPTRLGVFGAGVWWQDDGPNTPHGLRPETGGRLSWRRRF